MKRVLIFSGTTEGRQLAEHLMKAGVFCDVCVATEYGAQVMEEFVTITYGATVGRRDETVVRIV